MEGGILGDHHALDGILRLAGEEEVLGMGLDVVLSGSLKGELAKVHQDLGQLGALGSPGGIEFVLAAGEDTQRHSPLHTVLGPVGHGGGIRISAQVGIVGLSALGVGVIGKDLAQLLPGHGPFAAEGALAHAGGQALIFSPGSSVGVPLIGDIVEGGSFGHSRTARHVVQGLIDHPPGHGERGAKGVIAGAVHDSLFRDIGDGRGIPGVRSHVSKDGGSSFRGHGRGGEAQRQRGSQSQGEEFFAFLHFKHSTFPHLYPTTVGILLPCAIVAKPT